MGIGQVVMNSLFKNRLLSRYINQDKEREIFCRVFRFCAFALLFFLNGLMSAYAQNESSASWSSITVPAQIRPVFWSQNARCGYDGVVYYALLYSEDNWATFDTVGSPGKRTLEEFHLESVRIYKKTNINDSAHHAALYYQGGTDKFPVGVARTYFIGLEGANLSGQHPVRYDTLLQLTVPTDYLFPQSPAVVEEATTDNGYGKRPSLSCSSGTGREQLKIIGGRYPYTIIVDTVLSKDHDTLAHYRSETIYEPQNTGTNPSLWNYWEYYTIDNLPPYEWRFQVTDSCHNTGQFSIHVIDSVPPPTPDYIEVLSKPPHDNDSNIVQINLVLKDSKYAYYLDEAIAHMKYNFYWDGCSEPSWKPLSNEVARTRNGGNTTYFVLSDTLCGNNTYEDVLCGAGSKTFHFRVAYDSCGETRTFSKDFELMKPDELNFDTLMHFVIDSTVASGYCSNIQYGHNDYFRVKYKGDGKLYATKNHEHDIHRYHFTYPLEWKFEIFEQTSGTWKTVKTESVTKISDAVYLYAQTLIDSLDDVYGLPIANKSIKLTLTDANGCLVYADTAHISLNYYQRNVQKKVRWSVSRTNGDHCCVDDAVITLREENTPLEQPLGMTTVTMYSSPYNDLYNFSAVYDPVERTWEEPHKEDYMNMAEISTSVVDGHPELQIRQPCLPSGKYRFRFVSEGCGLQDTTVTLQFYDVYTTRIKSEVHRVEAQRCSNLKVVYDGGEAILVKQGHDPGNGVMTDPVEVECTTEIRIVSGENGGYAKNHVYGLHEPIELTMPGVYVVEIKPVPPTGSLCEPMVFMYDTIDYTQNNFSQDYSVALLCQSYDENGHAYVSSINGAEPVTYTLYKIPNRDPSQGKIRLGEPNHDGIFRNVPFNGNDSLSCTIEDDCGLSAEVDVPIMVLANLQKVWFENGGVDITLCQGQTVRVNALQYGNIFQFQWWFEDEEENNHEIMFTSSNPGLFLSHDSQSGWYHVKIENTGCYELVEDSVRINVVPAPKLLLSKDTVICPTKPANLTITPQKSYPDDDNYDPVIHYSIAVSNADGIDTFHFSGHHGENQSLVYATSSDAKVYPISIWEEGGSCEPYTVADPEDTVYITMDVEHMVRLDAIMATDTAVCIGSTASLRAKVNGALITGVEPETLTYRWFTDYAQTHPWTTDVVSGLGWTDYHDTANITQQTVLFVSVDGMEDKCPSTNGITNDVIRFGEEEYTQLDYETIYRFYDSGGADGDYATGEFKTHRFSTVDGSRVLLHLNSLELSSVSRLYIFTGPYTQVDSLLYDFGMGDNIPEYILSNSNYMTIGFWAGVQGAPGWDAVIQHAPGIAVADVLPKAIAKYKTKVCRMESASTCEFDYPYRDVLANVRDIVGYIAMGDTVEYSATATMDSLVWDAMRVSSEMSYVFEGYVTDGHGHRLQAQNSCDSMARFEFTVRNPATKDTTAIITSLDSMVWRGNTYRTTGDYSMVATSDPCNCDTVEVLHLIVLETNIHPIDTTICCDDSVKLVIEEIKTPDAMSTGTLRPAIGDILCAKRDGTGETVLPPDTFFARVAAAGNEDEMLYPIGVVFDIEFDMDGYSGRVIALRDACDTVCQYSVGGGKYTYDKITTKYSQSPYCITNYINNTNMVPLCLADLNGRNNTFALRDCCVDYFPSEGAYNAFMQHAPAAAVCYYYDPAYCYTPSMSKATGEIPWGWYLPSVGELYRYFIRRDIVNATIKNLQQNGYPRAKRPYEDLGDWPGKKYTDGKEIDGKYHTSTEKSSKAIYRLDYKGMLNNNDSHPKFMVTTRLSLAGTSLNNVIVQVQGLDKSYSYYFHYARAIRQFRIFNE